MTKPIEIPAIAERARMLSAAQAACMCGMSLQHFRRMYRTGKAPKGIRIGERKLGWPLGVVTDFLESKHEKAA